MFGDGCDVECKLKLEYLDEFFVCVLDVVDDGMFVIVGFGLG